MNSNISTRTLIAKNVVFVSTNKLMQIYDELQEAIEVYKRYDTVYFWKPAQRKETDYEKKIQIGFFLKIRVEIMYRETSQKCIVTRSIYINNKKKTVRVLKTMCNEIEQIINDRKQLEASRKKLMNRRSY
ncbi:MAG: hypothetical protein J6C16_00250 [Clostridia bacterium]|nr:hypothetical protein [Clostridia bacterium]